MPLVKLSPELEYKARWLSARIDFDHDISGRQLELELQRAVDEFVKRMEQKGHRWLGGDVNVVGPLPHIDFEQSPEAQKVPRDSSGGRTDYVLQAAFLVRETLMDVLVPRAQTRDAKKESGIWRPRGDQWQPM